MTDKNQSKKSSIYVFDFFDIFQKCYFFILFTFLSMCANFQCNLIFLSWKKNKIKRYYDLRITNISELYG